MVCGPQRKTANAEPDLSIHLNNTAPRKTLLLNARDVKTNLIDTVLRFTVIQNINKLH